VSTKLSVGRIGSIYELIKANRDAFSVPPCVGLFDIAPSGHYAWVQKPISNRTHEDEWSRRQRR
jgi:hypothetical protein